MRYNIVYTSIMSQKEHQQLRLLGSKTYFPTNLIHKGHTYFDVDSFSFERLDRRCFSRHVPVELLLVLVPLDGVERRTFQVELTGQ